MALQEQFIQYYTQEIIKKLIDKICTIKNWDKNLVWNYIMKSHIDWKEIKSNPYTYLQNLNDSQVLEIIQEANYYYHNGQSIVSDEIYEIVKHLLETRKKKTITLVGAEISVGKKKAKLPYILNSMDKNIKMENWIHKFPGPYRIDDKLDGATGLFHYRNGKLQIYTRGNGVIGQDITQLQHIIPLPKPSEDMSIRGEFIIPKQVWEASSKKLSNARNTLSGIINSKTVDSIKHKDIASKVVFMAYEVITPVMKPSKQLEFLRHHGFDVVHSKLVPEINKSILSKTLLERRELGEYEIDGIIVLSDHIYQRPQDNKNPKYAFAFKMVLDEQVGETTVIQVEWNPSSWNLLKPRIRITPTILEGVEYNWVTGHDARHIVSKLGGAIGPGAIIKIVRSGGVIPKVMEVIKPAAKPQMPSVPYHWNESGVNIILSEKNNPTVEIKKILRFIEKLGIEVFKKARITQCYHHGINTIPKILKATVKDFLSLEGIQKKMATKIYNNIQTAYQKATITQLMAGSGLFGSGLGRKKIGIVVKAIPEFMEIENEELSSKINNLNGFSSKTTQQFMQGYEKFKQFMEKLPSKDFTSSENNSLVSNKLQHLEVLFTGHNDVELSKLLQQHSAKIHKNYNKKINVLVVKDLNTKSSKMEKAQKNNIPIYNIESFKEKYFSS